MKRTALAVLLVAAGVLPAAEPRLQLSGEWRQGHVIIGRTVPGAQVTFNARTLRISDNGQFVLGLDRDEPAKATLILKFPGGGFEQREFTVEKREYQIQRIDGLPPDKVTPPAEALARIKREQALARAARKRDTARTDFTQKFIWPCTGRISGSWGNQRILNGEPKSPHYGVDVAAPAGTPVRAPAGGAVSLAHPDMYFSGGTVFLDHGQGLSSSFMHLSRVLVKEGDVVEQGQVIAEVGATGRATGAHLHWGLTWFDARVDAALLAGAMPASGDGSQGSGDGEKNK